MVRITVGFYTIKGFKDVIYFSEAVGGGGVVWGMGVGGE